MALNTYTALKASIADFLNRDDLTAVIPDFITLAEAQINRDVRHWNMEARSSGQQSVADEYMQYPADWVETIRLHLTATGTTVVNLISRDAMADKRSSAEDVSGTPIYYTHADGQFQLYPTPSADTAVALDEKVPPAKSPRPVIFPSAHLKASFPLVELPSPTITTLKPSNLPSKKPVTPMPSGPKPETYYPTPSALMIPFPTYKPTSA